MKKKDLSMFVRFWGVRGSVPTPGKNFIKYGGNTACVELRCGNTIIIFDAGTGIRMLGESLAKEFYDKPIQVHLFISHTHWDHIQGFPFFALAYNKNATINFYGGHSVSTLEKLILGQMDKEYFPVSLFELSSKINFIELSQNAFTINDIVIYYTHLFHPGLSLGFRVEYDDRVFVYASDNEVLNDPELGEYNLKNIGTLIKNADILVADCQYTPNEYKSRIGWGHSSIEIVAQVASRFGVKHLVTYHHDPSHTDDDIAKTIRKVRKLSLPIKITAAQEGTTLYLSKKY